MKPRELGDADLRARLQALRVDPAGAAEFQAALHRRLCEAGPPPAPGWLATVRAVFQRRPGVAWPAVGFATGLAAFALLFALRPDGGPATPAARPPAPVLAQAAPQAAVVRVPSSKVAVINLNFSADVAVKDADFRVTLPDGLAFWSEEGKLADRSFHWKQDLDSGDTAIPIAVRGERPGRYRVVATAVAGGRHIAHEVWLEVTEG